MKTMLHDGASMAAGDVLLIGTHVVKPFVKHEHGCLVCGDRHNAKRHSVSALEAILPVPASSDLDLVATNSELVRQMVVLGLDCITTTQKASTKQSILRFAQDLMLHSGYNVTYHQDLTLNKFHVFTCFIADTLTIETCLSAFKIWLREIVCTMSSRVAIIAPKTIATTMNEIFADEEKAYSKTTIVYFDSLEHIVDILLHMSFVTKHRVTANNILKAVVSHRGTVEIVGDASQEQCLFF